MMMNDDLHCNNNNNNNNNNNIFHPRILVLKNHFIIPM